MSRDVLTTKLYDGEAGYSLSCRPNVHVDTRQVPHEWSVGFVVTIGLLGGLLCWILATLVMA